MRYALLSFISIRFGKVFKVSSFLCYMIKAKVIIIIIAFILALSLVQAATIYGTIYGPDLELAEKALVEINSTPKQNMVANDGTYSFIVSNGTYEIEAYYSYQGVLLYDKETITLPSEGDFVIDLILFETVDIEDLEFDENELKLIEELLKEKKGISIGLIIGIIIAAIAIVAIMIYFFYRKSIDRLRKKLLKKKRKKKFKAKAVKEKVKPTGDEVMTQTLAILKREKRVTQKDLRKELGISEAKASLVITDLESQGKVRKIKKGRGNIIIYQP